MSPSPFHLLNYHLQVSLLGNSFLRYKRLRSELKQSNPNWWRHDHLEAPFKVAPQLKELVSRHYLQGRYANLHHKVAWVTSGGPVEFLKALGFYTLYPENHGAMCGVTRKTPDISGEAEHEGYSRDICSYARTDIGSVISGKTPVGKLPKPDLLMCCTNICQTVLYWYQVLADHFKCPLIIIDTPFMYSKAPEHAISFVRRQIEEAIPVAEKVAGRSLGAQEFEDAMRRAADATNLWLQIMQRSQHRPAPMLAFDQFFHMAPIVEMRGDQICVDYYDALLQEVDERVEKGISALKNERKRVLWDNLPIWHAVRPLSEQLAQEGAAVVASTYTNAWGELAPLIKSNEPLDSMAQVYLHPILNQGAGHKLEVMKRMVKDFHLDGVIMHSDRSCKPYSIGQIDQRERLISEAGVPALLLEADHNDPRSYSEEQAGTRISAFIEMMEAKKVA